VEQFGPYRLEELIGRGGMGEVYRAVDTRKGRTVAVKRLIGPHSDDAVFRERFRRESLLAARISSPHIAPFMTSARSTDSFSSTWCWSGGPTWPV
jgi:serine/threonine-protein kinase